MEKINLQQLELVNKSLHLQHLLVTNDQTKKNVNITPNVIDLTAAKPNTVTTIKKMVSKQSKINLTISKNSSQNQNISQLPFKDGMTYKAIHLPVRSQPKKFKCPFEDIADRSKCIQTNNNIELQIQICDNISVKSTITKKKNDDNDNNVVSNLSSFKSNDLMSDDEKRTDLNPQKSNNNVNMANEKFKKTQQKTQIKMAKKNKKKGKNQAYTDSNIDNCGANQKVAKVNKFYTKMNSNLTISLVVHSIKYETARFDLELLEINDTNATTAIVGMPRYTMYTGFKELNYAYSGIYRIYLDKIPIIKQQRDKISNMCIIYSKNLSEVFESIIDKEIAKSNDESNVPQQSAFFDSSFDILHKKNILHELKTNNIKIPLLYMDFNDNDTARLAVVAMVHNFCMASLIKKLNIESRNE